MPLMILRITHDVIEHTISSCQEQLLVHEESPRISTFHRDVTAAIRKTNNDYRLELLDLIQAQKLAYTDVMYMTSTREKVKCFNQIKAQIREIRTGIDRMRLSRHMNRKIREALTRILTRLQVTDRVCSEEKQIQKTSINSITQYLIQRNPSEIGTEAKEIKHMIATSSNRRLL